MPHLSWSLPAEVAGRVRLYTASMTDLFNRDRSLPTRRTLRQQMPQPERLLWYRLRDRRFSQFKFRRQFSIDRYIVDFFCPQANLVIELDGDAHCTGEAVEYDKIRNEYMRSLGLTVLRFTNDEVRENLEGVLEMISAHLKTSPGPPAGGPPSPS